MSRFTHSAYVHPESISGIHFRRGDTTTESYNQLLNTWNNPQPVYLPLLSVSLNAHVLSTATRTTLTQTFYNPSEHLPIPEARYTFPLYANCCILSFVCHIGDTKVITGAVQPKEKAKATYSNAVRQDQTAGLLEQSTTEVFTIQLGNIPPGATIKVEIGYIAELKHDSEADGIKLTIPMAIAPRYGVPPPGAFGDKSVDKPRGGIELCVEVTMAEKIRSVQSSSHPISVHLGTHDNSVSAEKRPGDKEKFDSKKALVTLFLSETALAQDFVLMVTTITPHFLSLPQALLETHHTIPGQQALMVTLVPRFNAPVSSQKPDLIFLVDRSGSMEDKIVPLKSALRVFLKSLPVNCRFNIVSFGGTYSFLWTQPQDYTRESLRWAEQHIESFDADLGGTEILLAMEELVKRREVPGQAENNTEVMILTDGEIWGLDHLLEFVKMARQQSKDRLRVFSLGIGRGVSHALVEGVAVMGGGLSQVLAPGEEHSGCGALEGKVVRMLNNALSDHTSEYKLEVIYKEEGDKSPDRSDDSDQTFNSSYERKNHNTKRVSSQQPSLSPTKKARTLSLFDPVASPYRVSHNPKGKSSSSSFKIESAKSGGRFSHLKDITIPDPLQAPFNIPNLFPFERSTAYLLLPPSGTLSVPKSVTLKATTVAGDELVLSIPVTRVEAPGTTIHQLAVRMVLRDLEEGRSWIHSGCYGVSTDENPERIAEYVEREGENLGEKWELVSKWTSFVAIEEEILQEVSKKDAAVANEQNANNNEQFNGPITGSDTDGDTDGDTPQTLTSMMNLGALEAQTTKNSSSAISKTRSPTKKTIRVVEYRGGNSMISMLNPRPVGPVMTPQVWDSISKARNLGLGVHRPENLLPQSANRRRLIPDPSDCYTYSVSAFSKMLGPIEQEQSRQRKPYTLVKQVDILIRMQAFDGSYSYTTELLEVLELSDAAAATKFMELSSIHTTALVAVYMFHRLGQFRDIWLLIVNKAWAFVDAAGDRTELEKRATELVIATAACYDDIWGH